MVHALKSGQTITVHPHLWVNRQLGRGLMYIYVYKTLFPRACGKIQDRFHSPNAVNSLGWEVNIHLLLGDRGGAAFLCILHIIYIF